MSFPACFVDQIGDLPSTAQLEDYDTEVRAICQLVTDLIRSRPSLKSAR